jgi:hypothetical protein
MNRIDVIYHTKEQLDIIDSCTRKGPTHQEVENFILGNLALEGVWGRAQSPVFLGIWDVGNHTEEETRETLNNAMKAFTVLFIKKGEDNVR